MKTRQYQPRSQAALIEANYKSADSARATGSPHPDVNAA
jgi:hypothetical protein